MLRYIHGLLNAAKGKLFVDNIATIPFEGLLKSNWLSKTISANNINAIDLQGSTLEAFWNYKGHTKADYLNLASHIPEIEARISIAEAEGLTRQQALDLCRNIDDLAPTVQSYYDNPVVVASMDDTYIATGDGRHRILAAQEMDVDIPVKVCGEYLTEGLEEDETMETIVVEETTEVKTETMTEITKEVEVDENGETMAVAVTAETTQTTEVTTTETTEISNDGHSQ